MAQATKKKSSATARKKTAVSKKSAPKSARELAKEGASVNKKSADAAEKSVLTDLVDEKTSKKKSAGKVAKKAAKTKSSSSTTKKVAKKAAAKKVAAKVVAKSASASPKAKTTAKKAVSKKTSAVTVKAKEDKKAAEKGASSKKTSKKTVPATKATNTEVSRLPLPETSDADSDEDFDTELSSVGMGPAVVPYERDGHYMDAEQLDLFSKKLAEWKQQLMEEVDRTVGHMKDDATNFPDPNDRATQEEEFSLELRTRDRERKLIKKINEAQKRIDDDEYGYCETCGIEIGVSRLEARPTAELCIDCKTLEEIRERQTA